MLLPDEFFSCKRCEDGLKREINEKPVAGDGPSTAKIMLIGESAGAEEMKFGRPFQGKAGENLNQFLASIGLNRKEIYISNTTRCRPYQTKERVLKNGMVRVTKSNRPPGKNSIEACASWLDYEIEKLSPSLIVTLGAVPLKRLTGLTSISEVHGTLLNIPIQIHDGGQKKFIYSDLIYNVFPLYHPASIIYRQELREVFVKDLQNLKNVVANK